MWLFLSSRIRTWLLFGVVLPFAAKAVHSAATRARHSDPSSTSARALSRADSTLQKVSRRTSKRSRKA